MIASQAHIVTGILIGLTVAVPIGPMGLLCIQRTLTFGMRTGVCTGLGAATVNVAYGLLILQAAAQVAPFMERSGRALSCIGALSLLWAAIKTFGRTRHGVVASPAQCSVLSPGTAYASAVVINLTNPMGPVLLVGLLAPAMAAGAPSWSATGSLLVGMFMAASTWWVCLSGGVSLLRARLTSTGLKMVNQVSATLLTIYSALALLRAATYIRLS